MQTDRLGSAGIPTLGFGTYRMSDAEVEHIFPYAIGAGFRHFDTAQIYQNEGALGRAIQRAGVPREELFLTTKVWVSNYSRERFQASIEESLARLKTNYVDLLLLHWPSDAVPLVDQVAGLDAAQRTGKARHVGVSNFTIGLVEKTIALAESLIATNQVECHPYLDQSALLKAMGELGIPVTAYYGMADGRVFKDRVLRDIANAHGKSVAQVVLRWLIQQHIVALSKTVSPARVAENITIFDFALSAEEMSRIHRLAQPGGRMVSPPGLAPAWD
ncbi:aldo/keto reductase [Bacillus sp. NP157]|nr:aldo/keto reductase [Bacillus sp. NP157]